ncbi:MAG TPA: hypothetical protein VGB90_09710 [Alphaproteobacteria bacterium]|jgi:hypothetical protein
MEWRFASVFVNIYSIGVPATMVYLTFFDGYDYNSWNWFVAILVNGFLSVIWPIYWGLLRWVMM